LWGSAAGRVTTVFSGPFPRTHCTALFSDAVEHPLRFLGGEIAG
jgi:hypothetical protein